MKLRRPILLALLLPLLLDLLVVFTAGPVVAEDLSFCEQEVEVLEGLFEAEEEIEEEEEFHSSHLFSNRGLTVECPAAYSRRAFLPATSSASPLAFGWRMPLRI